MIHKNFKKPCSNTGLFYLYICNMQKPDRSCIETIVFLKTDPDKFARMITGYKVNKHDIIYELTCGTQTTNHYDFEFTSNLDEIKGKVGF